MSAVACESRHFEQLGIAFIVALVIEQSTEELDGCETLSRVAGLVYKGDPNYVRTSNQKLRNAVHFGKQRGQQNILIAYRDGLPVSCVIARLAVDTSLDASWGTLGWFESLDDSEAATSLLREAVQWLRKQGVEHVIGPMDGDTWHRYRFSTGPYEEPPFLMEPYNPTYYPRLWEEAGFEPQETYHSKKVENVEPIAEKFKPIYDRVIKRGYKLQPYERSNFDEGLERLYKLSLTIFAGNTLYTDISWDSFRELYLPMKSVLDSRLAWFAKSPSGEDVGFLFALQDFHAAAVATQGRSDLLAKIRFLLNKRHAKAINIKSMGVVPGHRRSGIGVALICEVYRQMLNKGFRRANLCLIHDDNPSTRLDGGTGTLLRSYCLYHYTGS